MRQRRSIIVLLTFLFIGLAVRAQVWQWSAPVKNARNADARAFLWIPENGKQVKAVIVAQNNMEELSIVENEYFRKEMAKLSFAIIWISPAFDLFFRFNEGAGDMFNSMMNELAAISGYTELQYAPVIGIGHSAAASWPYYFAAWDPQRTLACISVSGQWPYVRHPQWSPDIWGSRNIDYIPSLETMGEYEAANTWSREGLKERSEHTLMPLSMLACPAEGHFAATQKKIQYIALYIKKAAQYRLPNPYPSTGAPVLQSIDPTKTGWLMEKWKQDEMPSTSPAPVKQYKGDTTQAFWFFDEEMVRVTEKYQSAYRRKQAQLLGYVQDGKLVKQRNTHLQAEMAFHPQADGITFTLKGAFLDTVPGESERPKVWTGLPVGARIGYAQNNRPVSIDRITGPFEKVSDTVFRLQLQKGLPDSPKNYVFTFAATHPGDSQYKPAVQQGQMVVPAANKEGAEQVIVFEKIPDVTRNSTSVKLQATSSASLPVHFYVKEGPATIEGNKLRFTQVPPHSKWPVKVTVVAWQYGRTAAPQIRSAQSVEQHFFIR